MYLKNVASDRFLTIYIYCISNPCLRQVSLTQINAKLAKTEDSLLLAVVDIENSFAI